MVAQDIASRRAAAKSGRVTKNRDIIRTGQARRLNDLMLQKNMTQADLARATGLPPYAVSRAVRGENVMGKEIVEAIAKALQVEPSEIVDLEARGLLNDIPSGIHVSNVGDGQQWVRINMYTRGEVHLIVQALLSRPGEMNHRHHYLVLKALEDADEEAQGAAPKNSIRSKRSEVVGVSGQANRPQVKFEKRKASGG